MDFLKELFGEESLSFEQFSKAVGDKGYKLADLSTGNYVAKKKFEDEIASRESIIGDLNEQLSTRDTDLENLKTQLENGNLDNKTKVSELTSQLEKLQGDYETSKSNYETKLNKQAYEFAVREFANSKQFSSNAAKRDFINEMLSANLTMKDKSILGAEDFVTAYSSENEDAFVVDTQPEAAPEPSKPSFVQPTPPTPNQDTNPFNFNFSGVR